jgi:hypothetical protein
MRKPDIGTPVDGNNERCGASFIVASNRHRSLGLVDDETQLVRSGPQEICRRAVRSGPAWAAWPVTGERVASLLGVKARKTYLRDVATAAASSRADKS